MKSHLVLVVALGSAPAAWAVPPPATGTFNYDVALTVTSFPASHSFACGTVSIGAAPLPTVAATGLGGCASVLQAIFGYYVEIAAPIDVLVPVSIASTATLSATGAAQAGYSLGVGNQTIDEPALRRRQDGRRLQLPGRRNRECGRRSPVLLRRNFGTDYAFVFSPGVGNGAVAGVVPEPETLALMLAGLAAGSIALRGRRHTRV